MLRAVASVKTAMHSGHAKQAAVTTRFLASLAEQAPQAKLVTIPASSYAEKARWALRIANIPFVEEKWAPLFVYLSTVPKGGRSVPLLTTPDVTLSDSADIVAFCAQTAPELRPSESSEELERYFDAKLGPHTRRCAYFLWFQNNKLSRKVVTGSIDGLVQRFMAWMLFPALRLALLWAMNINATSAERSWLRIEGILAEAETRLGDGPIGSRFLAGTTFSSADIAFCSHVAVLVLPREHEFIAPYITMDAIQDPVFHARFEKLRSSKIGQYVLWCYRNKRPMPTTM
ncbi:hypothetical protein PF005_g24106 [Phytophthora fragariae]|uniref:GST N-terminal domain-containing protein n=1 Tax=Phytophthora fragariae TaxID=53985 RepID=A0A6A3RK32_9STRA|nr:hypothetical protein PF003_g9552 [Phytophthora fragariae]KAE8925250.1 hypothetical protein PF009_g24541 [Phytophthora fragariae]KAE8979552.1 hypothetical protein PF011_g22802 [Phytophthora fragariae]KAE9077584.1 hypothetical protein PF010_g23460 [Phytophthora fragariae]KAE9078598.1 hypothetical protein PF007_g23786 [Phytophthora fragariae]